MNVLHAIIHTIQATPWMQLVGTLFSVVAIWLTTRENLWNFPLGLASVILIGVVLYNEKLYADTFLQTFYFCAMAYGWWCWTHPDVKRPQRPVTRLTLPQLSGLLVFALAATALCTWLLAKVDDPMPWRDAFIAVFGIASQWLQARKKMETWPGWVLVNTAGVIIFLALDLYWFVFLYALFWILSFVGWHQWLASYRQEMAA